MKVLVLGGGGREDALCWRLAGDENVTQAFCAPGNPGTARYATNVPLDPADPVAVGAFVRQHDIDLTVVGPELPLTRGVADVLSADGRVVFGPTQRAAELESSKVFAKAFMARHGIPTAASEVCTTPDEARQVIASGRFPFPVVLKADGLAAGKGVIIANDGADALRAVESMMVARQFGAAGERIVIEEHLQGPEVSVFAIADGERAVFFDTAQDHKRAYDDDRGPNTGGMGAFAPSALLGQEARERITRLVMVPTIEGMRAEGRPFRGFLYAGLMLTADGPKVLEFNVRLGDPEAQVILPMLGEDLAPILCAAASGRLDRGPCRLLPGATVGVVVASAGYPERYETGKLIDGVTAAAAVPGVLVFHAGTAMRDAALVTAGGRVLTVVGAGDDYATAMSRAYTGVARLSFAGMHYRRDIGRKALIA